MTVAADGRPRPVPITFAYRDDSSGLVLYSALDEKRKTVADPRALARVRNIGTRPRVVVLADRWDEDWSRLAWLRLEGMATLLEPPQGGAVASASLRRPQADAQRRPAGRAAELKPDDSAAEHSIALGLLRARYPQYAAQHLESRPVIRIAVQRVSGWTATDVSA